MGIAWPLWQRVESLNHCGLPTSPTLFDFTGPQPVSLACVSAAGWPSCGARRGGRWVETSKGLPFLEDGCLQQESIPQKETLILWKAQNKSRAADCGSAFFVFLALFFSGVVLRYVCKCLSFLLFWCLPVFPK